jgi:hypothetical protein
MTVLRCSKSWAWCGAERLGRAHVAVQKMPDAMQIEEDTYREKTSFSPSSQFFDFHYRDAGLVLIEDSPY